MAIDFWGDAALLVPWAEYEKTGNIHILEESYESMKKYVNACKFWANLIGVGKHRYIWHTPSIFHFGDCCKCCCFKGLTALCMQPPFGDRLCAF